MSQKVYGRLFLSIGAMKAGTTWLYAVLAHHPALHFTPEKELHYFYHKYIDPRYLSQLARLRTANDRYLRFNPERVDAERFRKQLRWTADYLSEPVDDHWYRSLFQLGQHETWACDFSNLHSFVPGDAWRRISDNCQHLRVLYTMRHPLKRLWSHTKFHLQVTGQLDKLDSWGPEEFEAFVRQPFIWDNAEYGAVLRRMREGLTSGQRLAIFYEDMHADQRGTLRKIEDFLALLPAEYPETVLEQRLTESVEHPMPEFFAGVFADDIARITAEIEAEGYIIPKAWVR